MSCICEPVVIDDADVVEHDGACPRCWDHVKTSDDIATIRRCIMLWNANGGKDSTFAKMAAGITARAVELGIERP